MEMKDLLDTIPTLLLAVKMKHDRLPGVRNLSTPPSLYKRGLDFYKIMSDC